MIQVSRPEDLVVCIPWPQSAPASQQGPFLSVGNLQVPCKSAGYRQELCRSLHESEINWLPKASHFLANNDQVLLKFYSLLNSVCTGSVFFQHQKVSLGKVSPFSVCTGSVFFQHQKVSPEKVSPGQVRDWQSNKEANFNASVVQNRTGRGRNFCLQKSLTGLVYFFWFSLI